MSARAVSFGPFTLDPEARSLSESGTPVRLGARALDILIALTERSGELVTKEELFARIWPDRVVVDANLAVHMTALRRALGDGRDGTNYIATIAGRGYQFVAPLVPLSALALRNDGQREASRAKNGRRPHPVELIGRGDAVKEIVARTRAERMVTLVGTAGIGKTSAALAVAELLTEDFAAGVWWVELAPLASADLLVPTIATTMGIKLPAGDAIQALSSALRGTPQLIVLDNCEHLIDGAAHVASGLLAATPELHLLATSREPLAIPGEHVHRLATLEAPAEREHLDAAAALAYPAVLLLAQRVSASVQDFVLDDEDAGSAARICRELDGIPLALEMAAARVAAFGMSGVAQQLDNRIRLLSEGQRGTPRQRSMTAALDWSFDLLSEKHRAILSGLGLFAGGFTLEAARHVCAPNDVLVDFADTVGTLVEKSLVADDFRDGGATRFRLLEITREYALEKLRASDSKDEVARRHAEYFTQLLVTARANAKRGEAYDPRSYAPDLDNLRAALDWALSSSDTRLGVALAAASGPIFVGMGLFEECHRWMTRAKASIGADSRGSRDELEIQATIASSMFFTSGITGESADTWSEMLAMARSLGAEDYQLDGLFAIWSYHIRAPHYDKAMAAIREHEALTVGSSDADRLTITHWSLGVTLHHAGGDLAAARRHFQAGLDIETASARQGFLQRIGFDRRAAGLALLAFVAVLQGNTREAMTLGTQAIEEGRTSGYIVPVCEVLLWDGYTRFLGRCDSTALEAEADELAALAGKYALASHHQLGRGLQGLCRARAGDLATAEPLLASSHANLVKSQYGPVNPLLVSELAAVMGEQGRIEEALAVLDDFARADGNPTNWATAELLRRRAELIRRLPGDHGAEEERLLREAMAFAREQGALLWEIRAAMSLADRIGEAARAIVSDICSRFPADGESADLADARAWLART